jgi:hypothetical protein
MEFLINKLAFKSTLDTGWTRSAAAGALAFLDRLEAAIGVAQAHRSNAKIHRADLQTLGLRAQ